MMGVLVQENNVVGSKRRVGARAEHGAHVVRPSRVIRHFRTSVFGHSYVGPDTQRYDCPVAADYGFQAQGGHLSVLLCVD